MALVAEIQEEGESNLIGVARYAMLPGDEPGLAESAVVVIDEYQKRGLGSLLLQRLVRYARSHDVRTFLATVHVSNAQIMRFIQRSGFPADKKMIEPGVWEIRVHLQHGI
jgi:GNAT superfamily N-acetyltransferase